MQKATRKAVQFNSHLENRKAPLRVYPRSWGAFSMYPNREDSMNIQDDNDSKKAKGGLSLGGLLRVMAGDSTDDSQDDKGLEDRDVETSNKAEKSPSELRARMGKVWASIKIQGSLVELRGIHLETEYLKTYSYKVVTPPDENFSTYLSNQGRLGWRIVHARRATKKAADGWTNIPVYEVILESAPNRKRPFGPPNTGCE